MHALAAMASKPHPLDELFAPAERTLYAVSPLTAVTCQLRFPSVLRIETTPAEFQERIRSTFPVFQRQSAMLPMQLPADLQQLMGNPSNISYNFSTLDGSHVLNLTSEAISLRSISYTRWEDFWSLMSEPIAALIELYKPALFSRVGLRYQNHIKRDALQLQDIHWSSLLRHELIAEIANSSWALLTVESRNVLRLRDANTSEGMFIQHGFANMAEPSNTTYLIDMDLYTDGRTDVTDATSILEQFHTRAWRAFRWCISDKLHHAMGPRNLDSDESERSY